MNSNALGARVKTILVLILFSVIGIGPIPVTSTIGLLVVLFRPRWFKDLVERIYAE
jgi:type III secretory pathway component EscS